MDLEDKTGQETGSVVDDVRADVAAAFASHKEVEPAEKPEIAAADADETAKADRLRNERGQFTKAEQAAEAAAKTVPDADPAQDKIAQPSNAAEPPTSWSADAKAKWSSLDPSIQAEIAKRETDMHSGGARWSEEKKHYEQTLAPLRQVAQRNGVSEQDGLNRLLAADDFLNRDPKAAIQWLANAYGVDLSQAASEPQPKADPVLAQLHQKVTSLEGTLQQREMAEIQSNIAAFASAPGHDHFEKVKADMGRLMLVSEQTGRQLSMEEAYQQACWANPEIRPTLIASQSASDIAARQAKEKEQADKARRGGLSVNGGPSTAAPTPPREYATVEDAVRAAYQQHRA